jgi:hypothetical protein
MAPNSTLLAWVPILLATLAVCSAIMAWISLRRNVSYQTVTVLYAEIARLTVQLNAQRQELADISTDLQRCQEREAITMLQQTRLVTRLLTLEGGQGDAQSSRHPPS